jgi:hypothetical protein
VVVGTLVVVVVLVLVLLFGGIPGVSLNASNGGSPTPGTHTVSFVETGLATGTNWSVDLFGPNGGIQNSTTSSISFSRPNGEFSYHVPSVNAYTAVPSGGIVVVNGSDVSVPISFSHFNVPLGTAFSWGSPINDTGVTISGCPSSSGHYCYSIVIAGASGGVGTSNIALELTNIAGATVTWPTGITISLFSPTNASAQATYDTTNSSWALVPPYDGALSAGFTLVFYTADTSSGLLGLRLAAIGLNGFSGTVASLAFS